MEQIDYQVARMIEHIERAYRLLAQRPGEWVALSRIADRIDAPKPIIDEAYRMLGRREDVSIVPESNQKILTQADWDAAAWIGNQYKHLISIR